jgi:hypothetical protein
MDVPERTRGFSSCAWPFRRTGITECAKSLNGYECFYSFRTSKQPKKLFIKLTFTVKIQAFKLNHCPSHKFYRSSIGAQEAKKKQKMTLSIHHTI